jgi:hypothetical protein
VPIAVGNAAIEERASGRTQAVLKVDADKRLLWIIRDGLAMFARCPLSSDNDRTVAPRPPLSPMGHQGERPRGAEAA